MKRTILVAAFVAALVFVGPAMVRADGALSEPPSNGQPAPPAPTVGERKTYVVPAPSAGGQAAARPSGGQWHTDNELPARFRRAHADSFSAGIARVDRLYVGGQRAYPPQRRTVTRRSSGYYAALSQRFAGEVRRIDERLGAAEKRLERHGDMLRAHEAQLADHGKQIVADVDGLDALTKRVDALEVEAAKAPSTGAAPTPTAPTPLTPTPGAQPPAGTPAPTHPPAATPAPGGPSLPGGAQPAPGQPSVHVPPRVAPDGQYLQAVYITPVAAGQSDGDAKPDGLVVRVFVDANFDGIHNQSEGLAASAPVTVTTPDGKSWQLTTGPKGEWTLPASALTEGTYHFRAREKAVSAEWPNDKEVFVPFEIYGDTLGEVVELIKGMKNQLDDLGKVVEKGVETKDLRGVVSAEVAGQFSAFEKRQTAVPAAAPSTGLPWWQLGFLVLVVLAAVYGGYRATH